MKSLNDQSINQQSEASYKLDIWLLVFFLVHTSESTEHENTNLKWSVVSNQQFSLYFIYTIY